MPSQRVRKSFSTLLSAFTSSLKRAMALLSLSLGSKILPVVISRHVVWDATVAAAAQAAVVGSTDVIGAVDAIVAEVRRLLTYEKGSTTIGIRLEELLEGGKWHLRLGKRVGR